MYLISQLTIKLIVHAPQNLWTSAAAESVIKSGTL